HWLPWRDSTFCCIGERLDQAIGAAGPAAGAGGSSALAGDAASSSAAAAGSSHARVQARHGLLIIFHPGWACRRRRSRRRWCARRPALDGEPRHARALRLREIVGAYLGETVDAPEKLQQAWIGVGRRLARGILPEGESGAEHHEREPGKHHPERAGSAHQPSLATLPSFSVLAHS